MLKIFYVPGTRSVRPIWLCYELVLPVEVEHIDFSSEYRDSATWREISPAGKVPAKIDGDLRMFESGAMLIDREFLLGKEFCAADIMMGYSIGMIERLLGEDYPNLNRYLSQLKLRDAYQQVVDLL